jgi:hypothetical protein
MRFLIRCDRRDQHLGQRWWGLRKRIDELRVPTVSPGQGLFGDGNRYRGGEDQCGKGLGQNSTREKNQSMIESYRVLAPLSRPSRG